MKSNHINDLAKHKLLLLYLLTLAPKGVTEKTLTTYVLEMEVMNYFLLKQYLQEMEEQSLILRGSGGSLLLLPQGEETLALFSENISEETKEDLREKWEKFTMPPENPRTLSSSTFEKEGKYYVSLNLTEGSRPFFALEMEVASPEEGEKTINNWKTHSEELYEKIRSLLTEY